MKKMKLKTLLAVINSSHEVDKDVVIKNVTNDIQKLYDETLVFHLNKEVEIDAKKLKELMNCFIITDQPILKNDILNPKQFIHVLDVKKSYQQYIRYYRNLFDIPVVAITGTCGKTTTKEMVRQILENNYNVSSTKSNINALSNNHHYLMNIDDTTDYGVFETAISYPGDLIDGCQFFKPTIGVITNIGVDHLSGCKTLDNYIRTKGEMLAGLEYKGTLIINKDDENIQKIDFSPYKGTIVTFGFENDADYYAADIVYKEEGMEFTLKHDKLEYPVYVPGLGRHNVYNALAALAVLSVLELDLKECINYLAKVTFIRSHLEFHKGLNKSTIIDDTWSSNPTSIKAAFEVLREVGKDKVKIVVLGKIAYLSDYAKDYYKEIGQMIVDENIDFLITTDSFSKQIATYAEEFGMNSDFTLHCKDNKELINTLECLLDENAFVLIKTSMFSKPITKVIESLIKK